MIDIRTDEHVDKTWIRWCKWLDKHGIRHPGFKVMRDEFFMMDLAAREQAKAEGRVEYPEIDVIPIYKTMFLEYGNDERGLTQDFLDEAGYAFRTASRSCIFTEI